MFVFVWFSRASAEFRTVAEELPAEPHYAGADWLLHSHGGVLHERVRQQGGTRIQSITCVHYNVQHQRCQSYCQAHVVSIQKFGVNKNAFIEIYSVPSYIVLDFLLLNCIYNSLAESMSSLEYEYDFIGSCHGHS